MALSDSSICDAKWRYFVLFSLQRLLTWKWLAAYWPTSRHDVIPVKAKDYKYGKSNILKQLNLRNPKLRS